MTARLIALTLLSTASLAFSAKVLLKDDFSNPNLEQRRASRGDWKFAGGAATCTQDDALYKKNKDHGPILFYHLPLGDALIRFAYKADGAKTLVFTANGADGHIFRFVQSERGASIRAFPAEGKEHTSISWATSPSPSSKANGSPSKSICAARKPPSKSAHSARATNIPPSPAPRPTSASASASAPSP